MKPSNFTEIFESTAPKPFVFVLMPFSQNFDNVYKLAIKGAAEDAGAYTERVDDQHFTGSILDRILNQINKADILVADMTGKNPNVYYEVGYAHALNRDVILQTQHLDDIPFDLKHRQHIHYDANNLADLKESLKARIKWSLEQRTKPQSQSTGRTLDLSVLDVLVPPVSPFSDEIPEVEGTIGQSSFNLPCLFKNVSDPPLSIFGQIVLFTRTASKIQPAHLVGGKLVPMTSFGSASIQVGQEYTRFYSPFNKNTGSLPPLGIIGVHLDMILAEEAESATEPILLRVQSSGRVEDFAFNLTIKRNRTSEQQPAKTGDSTKTSVSKNAPPKKNSRAKKQT